MNIPSILLTAKPAVDLGKSDESQSSILPWIVVPLIIIITLIIIRISVRLTKGDVTAPSFRQPRPPSPFPPYTQRRIAEVAENPPPAPVAKPSTKLDSVIGEETVQSQVTPTVWPASSPVQPAGATGPKVVSEWTGDAALRGDFSEIMGALGKRMDKLLNQAKAKEELVDQLKSQNEQLARDKAQLMDLLHNDRHRALLLSLVQVESLCIGSIRHFKDNPQAVESMDFIRGACRDQLLQAGLTPYDPLPGTKLADLEGGLMVVAAKSVATEDPERKDTVCEVISPGYYHERDGRKLPVAKAEIVFYRLSSNSTPTPAS